MARLLVMSLVGLSLAFTTAIAQDAAKQPAPLDRAALEKKFAETMSDAVMVGSFTTTSGEGEGKAPKQEKYTLGKVEKLRDDYWLFNVRIQYGEKDATLPLPLQVQWAGDTPVITLTNQPVPGFGTFTARVLIYDDHYAGFWDGANHGGHLFGRITHPSDDVKKPDAKPAADSK